MQNLIDPAILFFLFGVAGGLVKSNLEIPPAISKFLSLYLLMALGLKGGFALAESGLSLSVLKGLGAALLLASVVPLLGYQVLKRLTSPFNAAAIAATYGSISAVTFITAESFLETQNLPHDGFMVAALALMESPAIIVGLLLVKLAVPAGTEAGQGMRWGAVLKEALLNGSVFLLVGSLLVGVLTAANNPQGAEKMLPFTDKMFYGALSFFLLDMGIVAAQRLGDLRRAGPLLIAFAVLMPLLNALIGVTIARGLGLNQGDALLFMVLCASASYIAVPAAMRMTVPEANPSLYISTSLGVTFPFNIVVGIPIYMVLVKQLIPAG